MHEGSGNNKRTPEKGRVVDVCQVSLIHADAVLYVTHRYDSSCRNENRTHEGMFDGSCEARTRQTGDLRLGDWKMKSESLRSRFKMGGVSHR